MTRGFGRFLRQNTIALLALFIALSGSAFAASLALPKNCVGTKQLKKNAVTSVKIKNNQVTGADVNESSLGKVPSAANADHATSADSATSATNATNATTATTATTATSANALNGYAASGLTRMGEGTTIGFVDTAVTAAFPSFQTAGSVTVTAPSPGYVLVTGVAPFYRRGSGTCTTPCRAVARLRDTGSGGIATLHVIGAMDGSSSGAMTLTDTWVFHVPAGTRTFLLEVAYAENADSGALGVFDTSINAVYSPFNLSGAAGLPVHRGPAHAPTGASTP